MFAFSLHLWDRRSPNGLLFWYARCLTHACKEWCSRSYNLHIRIDSMSTVNWSTNVILQSTSIHGRGSWIHIVCCSPKAATLIACLYHWLTHIQLQIASMICLTFSNLTAKGWWKKRFPCHVFFSATENPTSWMFPKRSKRFCLCAWLQDPKGRGTNSFSWSLWHFSPRLCIAEHDSGEPAKIIKNGRCKNRTRKGFRFPCEGRGNEF